jgi:GNAT superfamily N-acetyltransferase
MNCAHTSIRPFQQGDEPAVVGVWYRSGQAAYTFLPTWQALTLEVAAKVFREVIRTQCDIWVGTVDEQVVAYLAMKGSYVDRMYVDPSEWRKGWGTRFVALAKNLSPDGLELHTHQENLAARALYEKHGFTAVKFGVSPPPECAPDVEYHWRPDNTPLPSTSGAPRAT